MAQTNTDASVLSAINDYIAALCENAQNLSENSVGARQCVINDLTDTARLLKQLGVDEIIWKRFYHVANALDDLKHGIVSPTLRATHVRNRISDNSATWAVRARVAVALECFLRSGMSLDEATAIISRQRSLKPLLRPGTDLKTAPLNWRNNLKRKKNKNDAATSLWDSFEEACTSAGFRASEEWKAAAKRFLGRASEDLQLLQSVNAI